MSKPKLSTKTPDAPEYNTLIGDHETINSLPRERRYAIVELTTKRVDLDVATGEHQATMQIIHIEGPQTQADEKLITDLLDTLFKKRTKLTARPAPDAGDTPLEGLATGLDDGVE